MADANDLTGGRTRRQFLQALGAAVGGVAVSGAGAAGFGSQLPPGQRSGATVIPGSYAFYRVLTTERLLPWPGNPGRLNPVADMTGVVLMAGVTPRLFMHVTLAASAIPAGVPSDPAPNALLLATMDYSQRPSIAGLKIVAYEGQSLDANNISGAAPELLPVRVDRIGTGDTNFNGLYATTITSQDLNDSVSINSAPGVYLYDPATDRWTQKARFGDVVGEGIEYGGIFGDVALADDDSVLFTAGTTEPVAGYGGAQALMLAPPGRRVRRSSNWCCRTIVRRAPEPQRHCWSASACAHHCNVCAWRCWSMMARHYRSPSLPARTSPSCADPSRRTRGRRSSPKATRPRAACSHAGANSTTRRWRG